MAAAQRRQNYCQVIISFYNNYCDTIRHDVGARFVPKASCWHGVGAGVSDDLLIGDSVGGAMSAICDSADIRIRGLYAVNISNKIR